MSEEIRRHQEEERQLRRLPIWSWYMKGARDMLLRLREHQLCGDVKPEAYYGRTVTEARVYIKAVLDLILYDQTSTDRFLSQDYDEVRFTDYERDKKGKLTKCRAFFARRTTSYTEL